MGNGKDRNHMHEHQRQSRGMGHEINGLSRVPYPGDCGHIVSQRGEC